MREGAADVYRHRRDVAALPGACAEHGAAYGRAHGSLCGGCADGDGFTFPQALVLVVGLAALGALDALHERGRTLTAWLDRRPAALRMALMLLGVLLVVIFGVWGTNYDAQAFIYFQF